MNSIFVISESAGWFLAESAARSLLILVPAILLGFFLRHQSAALRHFLWTGALLSTFVLPIFSLLLPPWAVLNLPAVIEPSSKRESDLQGASVASVSLVNSHSLENQVDRSTVPGLRSPALTTAAGTLTRKATGGPENRWLLGLLLCWATGTGAALTPLVCGWWQVWRRCKRTPAFDDPCWLDVLESAKRELGVGRQVTLCRDTDTLVPATVGLMRPVILLPEDANRWSAERRRLVLLHELAHIRRCDWLSQILGSFACAIYWFNPLAWFAAKQMRREQECACDDLVIACGTESRAYADELLSLAGSQTRRASLPAVGVPMARQSFLQGRLIAILDESRDRHPMSRVTIACMILAIMLLVVPIAIVRAVDKKTADTPLKSSPMRGFKPVTSVVLSSAPESKRFLSLEDGQWHTSAPVDSPGVHLENDSKSGWQLVVENAYNYHCDRERASALWASMTAEQAAEPAGLAAAPFERKGFYRISKGDLPITVLLPGMGLLQVSEIVESDPFSVLLRYKLVAGNADAAPDRLVAPESPDASSLVATRKVVDDWLAHVGAEQTDLMWALTTRTSDAAPSPDLQQTWEFKTIRAAWSLGNVAAAIVVSTRYKDNAGRQRALVFALEKRDGQWLIRQQFSDSPENVYRHVAGFAAHPGMRYDPPAENFIGEWKHLGFLGIFESHLLLRADGTGTLIEKQRGKKISEKPLKWAVAGDRIIWKSDSEVAAEIVRLEHDFFALKFGDGQIGYQREAEPTAKNRPPTTEAAPDDPLRPNNRKIVPEESGEKN
jgi:beta-lactamase regulating signal transducer with metallopeptidase domain